MAIARQQHGYSMGTALPIAWLQHYLQHGYSMATALATAVPTAWLQHGYSSPYSMGYSIGYSIGYSTPRIIDLSGFLGSLAPRVVRFLGSP